AQGVGPEESGARPDKCEEPAPGKRHLHARLSGATRSVSRGGGSGMRRASAKAVPVFVFALILMVWMTLPAQDKPATVAEPPAKERAARSAKTVVVEMKGFAFVPETVEINVGDSVQWVNRDTAQHTATRTDAPAFNTGLL